MIIRPASLALLAIAAWAQPYDLLLKGGHLIDARNNVNGPRDLAIRDGRVAIVSADIPPADARQTIDISGLYIVPGLIDLHTHLYANIAHDGGHGVFPDQTGFRSGVTTMVDAGSSGWRTFPDFRHIIIDNAEMRVLAMLNIVGTGRTSSESGQNAGDMDPEQTVAMAKKHADVIVGIKSAHWRAPDFTSVRKAVEAGALANLPVMVDFGFFLPERPYQKMVLEILRPGDMSTHFYRWPAPLLDQNEKLLPYLHDARRRGVKFDVGHGGGSFHFRNAEPAVKQGFWPDSISTDLHSGSVNGPVIDILNVMSKFLALGMPLEEVVARATNNPAAQIRRPELGHLAVGAEADIAVLRLDKGNFGFVDSKGGRIDGTQRLGCEMTLRTGRIVFDLNGRAGAPWRKANLDYPTR